MIHLYLVLAFLGIWTAIVAPLVILGKLINPMGTLSHTLGRIWSLVLLKVSRVKIETEGLEHIDQNGQYIFISNHTSAFDILAIYWGIKNKNGMLAKKQLLHVPVFGWAMWAAGHFFIDRHNHKKAVAVMDQVATQLSQRPDHSLVIFAEGTRSMDGQLGPFKKGAFILSLNTGIPVVPIVLNGAFAAKSKYEHRINPSTIRLSVLPPMDPANYTKENRQKFVDDARDHFIKHYDPPPVI